MTDQEKCIFCQIAKGKIPCHKIYEDDLFLAFLDIAPHTEGHTLLIPKKHFPWLWEMPHLGEFFTLAGRIARHYQQQTGDQFVPALGWGLDVHHAHLHLLPNAQNLRLGWPRQSLTEAKAKELVAQLALKK